MHPATQYEVARTKLWPRRRSWQYVWANLADPFHPKSLEDWEAHQARQAMLEDDSEDDTGPGMEPVT